jgi:hypothetical protein
MGRFVLALGFALVVAVGAFGQAPAVATNSITGVVLNDRTGLPLARAHVVLTPGQSGLNAVGVDTDDKGSFEIRDVEAGRYSLVASRDGYLASSAVLMGTVRLPQTFVIGSKEAVANLTFRLRPFAVMAGRISFEDGEAAMNIRVEAYREYRSHLRHGYLLVTSTVTNDRGEYRMFGLHPGSYIVAAAEESAQALNKQIHAPQYTTTFYLNATKLSEAVPVKVDYGQEINGVDLSLARVRKVSIRGSVISGQTGDAVAASISLQRLDAHNTASIAVTVPATFDRDHRFELRDITPGPYIIWAESAEGGKAMVGHAPLTVGEADIDNVALTIEGERPASAVLVVAGGVKLNDTVRLRFEPRNERGKVVEASQTIGGGPIKFSLMGNDVYDLFVTNLPNDFFLAAVRVNGVDVMPLGIDGIAASSRPFEVVIDSRGGRVSGRALGSDDSVWSRANIALIPDPPKGRVQSYRESSADENGVFVIRAVAAGRYILIAWLDDPPCDYYDPDGLAVCRATGLGIEVPEAGEQNVELKMKALPKR